MQWTKQCNRNDKVNGQSLTILGSEANKKSSKVNQKSPWVNESQLPAAVFRYFAESIQGAFQKTGVKAEAIDRIYVTRQDEKILNPCKNGGWFSNLGWWKIAGDLLVGISIIVAVSCFVWNEVFISVVARWFQHLKTVIWYRVFHPADNLSHVVLRLETLQVNCLIARVIWERQWLQPIRPCCIGHPCGWRQKSGRKGWV